MISLRKAVPLSALLLAATLAPQAAMASPYFKCSSGYSFDVNNSGSGARCGKH